jgi:hypothetical protein
MLERSVASDFSFEMVQRLVLAAFAIIFVVLILENGEQECVVTWCSSVVLEVKYN